MPVDVVFLFYHLVPSLKPLSPGVGSIFIYYTYLVLLSTDFAQNIRPLSGGPYQPDIFLFSRIIRRLRAESSAPGARHQRARKILQPFNVQPLQSVCMANTTCGSTRCISANTSRAVSCFFMGMSCCALYRVYAPPRCTSFPWEYRLCGAAPCADMPISLSLRPRPLFFPPLSNIIHRPTRTSFTGSVLW